MNLFALLTREPRSLVSAASSIARAWEEYRPESLTIIYTPGVPKGRVQVLKDWSARLIGKDSIGTIMVDSGPEALEGETHDVLAVRLASIIDDNCASGRGVMLVSSGSRRLATAAVLASLAADCSVDVVHVHFYFGPWSGLPYPYTPLRLQPLIVMSGEGPPSGEASESAAARMYEAMNEAAAKLVLGRLPPLRSVVAELARRINKEARPHYTLPSSEPVECGKLLLETPRQTIPAADLCSDRELATLAARLGGYLQYLEEAVGGELRSLLAWTGLAHLRAGDEALASLMLREKTVIDSSIVYYGAHRYFWEGADIYVPECLIREIHMNMAESIKTRRARSGRPAGRAVVDVLAYLALRDMLESGAPVLPTTPGYCDTSIPKIDPLILEGKVLVTSDSGALRYWRSHPTKKIVKDIVLASFEPDSVLRQRVDPRSDPASLPRLLYSIYQTIVAIDLMANLQVIREDEAVRVHVVRGGEKRRIPVPTRTLLKAIGYA